MSETLHEINMHQIFSINIDNPDNLDEIQEIDPQILAASNEAFIPSIVLFEWRTEPMRPKYANVW